MPQDEARRGVAARYKKISKNPCSQGVNPLTPMIWLLILPSTELLHISLKLVMRICW